MIQYSVGSVMFVVSKEKSLIIIGLVQSGHRRNFFKM